MNTLYSSGLSSCTLRCDYGLYDTHRTCCNMAYCRKCHTVFYPNYGKKRSVRHIQASTHSCTLTRTHTHTYTHTYTLTNKTPANTHRRAHARTYAHARTHGRTHARTHTLTNAQTHIASDGLQQLFSVAVDAPTLVVVKLLVAKKLRAWTVDRDVQVSARHAVCVVLFMMHQVPC